MSCSKAPDAASVAQAAALDHFIDQLRQAPNAAKRPHLEALAGQACDEPALCELKKRCHDAYAKHLQALDEIARATREIERATPAALDRRVEIARAQLIASEQAAQQCVTSQAAVRQKYGLNQ